MNWEELSFDNEFSMDNLSASASPLHFIGTLPPMTAEDVFMNPVASPSRMRVEEKEEEKVMGEVHSAAAAADAAAQEVISPLSSIAVVAVTSSPLQLQLPLHPPLPSTLLMGDITSTPAVATSVAADYLMDVDNDNEEEQEQEQEQGVAQSEDEDDDEEEDEGGEEEEDDESEDEDEYDGNAQEALLARSKHIINRPRGGRRRVRPVLYSLHNSRGKRIYCMCRRVDDGRFMIQCDTCTEWFHGDCVGISKRQAEHIETYECGLCVDFNDLPEGTLVSSASSSVPPLPPSSTSSSLSSLNGLGGSTTTARASAADKKRSSRRVKSANEQRQRTMKAARKTSSTKSSRSNTPDKPVGSSSGSRVASSSSSAANNESIRKMARRGFAETLKSIFMLVKEFREKTTGEAATGGGSSPKKLPKKHQWMESLQVSSAINLEDSRFLALEIEEEMYQQCAVYGECGSRYKAKYRSLQFNLKDEKNGRLRRRLLNGDVTPSLLVALPPEELASEAVAGIAEQVRKQSIQSSVRTKADEATIITKTHKGDVEIVINKPGQMEVAPLQLQADFVKKEKAADKIAATSLSTSSPIVTSIASLAAAKSTSTISTNPSSVKSIESLDDILARMGGPASSSSNINTSPVDSKKRLMDHQHYDVDNGAWASTSTSDILEDIGTSKRVKTGDYMESTTSATGSSSSLFDTNGPAFDLMNTSVEGPVSPGASPPGSPCLPPYTPPSEDNNAADDEDVVDNNTSENAGEPSSSSATSKITATLSRLEPVWRGKMNMHQVGKYSGWCSQVGGVPVGDIKAWEDVLPAALSVDGRIATDKVLDYLSQQRQSNTKEIVLVEFKHGEEQDMTSSPNDSEGYMSLFEYFHSRQRIAVIGHNYVSVKDMYVFPLAKNDPLPAFVEWIPGGCILEEKDRDRDILLGVIILMKDVVRGGGATSAASSKISKSSSLHPKSASSSSRHSQKKQLKDIVTPAHSSSLLPPPALPATTSSSSYTTGTLPVSVASSILSQFQATASPFHHQQPQQQHAPSHPPSVTANSDALSALSALLASTSSSLPSFAPVTTSASSASIQSQLLSTLQTLIPNQQQQQQQQQHTPQHPYYRY